MAKNISGYDLETIKRQIKADPAVQEAAAKYLELINEHTAVIAQNRVLRDVDTVLSNNGGDEGISQRVRLQEQRATQLNEKSNEAQAEIKKAIKNNLDQTCALNGVTSVDKISFNIDKFILELNEIRAFNG